jgi:hypothetical protein
MSDDLARAARRSRTADEIINAAVAAKIDLRADRKRHILAALTAAAVPLDNLTIIALRDVSNEINDFLETFCRECDVP